MAEQNFLGQKFYSDKKSVLALVYALNLPGVVLLVGILLVFQVSLLKSRDLFGVFLGLLMIEAIIAICSWGFYLCMTRISYELGEDSFLWRLCLLGVFEEKYLFGDTSGVILSQGPLQRRFQSWSMRIASKVPPEKKTNLVLRWVAQDNNLLQHILATVNIRLNEKPVLEVKGQFSNRLFWLSYRWLISLFCVAVFLLTLCFLLPGSDRFLPFVALGVGYLYVLWLVGYLCYQITPSFMWNLLILLILVPVVMLADKFWAQMVMFGIVVVPSVFLYCYWRKKHQDTSLALYSNHLRYQSGLMIQRMSFVPYCSIETIEVTPVGSEGFGHLCVEFAGGYLMGQHGEYTVANRVKGGYLPDIMLVKETLEKLRQQDVVKAGEK